MNIDFMFREIAKFSPKFQFRIENFANYENDNFRSHPNVNDTSELDLEFE